LWSEVRSGEMYQTGGAVWATRLGRKEPQIDSRGKVRLTGSRTTVDLYKSDGVAVAPQGQSLHDVLQTDVMRVHSIATKDLL
jgi:hypothetical protein